MREKRSPHAAWGRCPGCGAAVGVEILKLAPAPVPVPVLPHGCPARVCEYPGCRVSELQDRIVQADDGAWFCPRHGLLVTVKALVALYQVEGDADWSEICELIAETLPHVVRKIEAAESGTACLGPARPHLVRDLATATSEPEQARYRQTTRDEYGSCIVTASWR